ncbi:MAG: zeta toxin family protein [Eggerthellaceae bacterium]
MKNLEKYTKIVDKLHKAGYDVIAIGTDIPTEEAIDRSKKRAAHTGRDVPVGIIRSSHGGFAMTFPKMMKIVDNYMLFDNSQPYGEPPTLICSREDGIQNKARWDEFVRKGNDWAKHKEEEHKEGGR